MRVARAYPVRPVRHPPRRGFHTLQRSLTMKSIVQFVALAAALAVPAAAMADDPGRRTLFIASAVEHPDNTATFPLHRGTSQGRTVFYILLDSSNDDDARALGINVSEKL